MTKPSFARRSAQRQSVSLTGNPRVSSAALMSRTTVLPSFWASTIRSRYSSERTFRTCWALVIVGTCCFSEGSACARHGSGGRRLFWDLLKHEACQVEGTGEGGQGTGDRDQEKRTPVPCPL